MVFFVFVDNIVRIVVMILMSYCRYVIFSYADSGMSNTLEVEEEEEVKIILKAIVFRSIPLLCGILHCSLIIDLT